MNSKWPLKTLFHRLAEPLGISMLDYLDIIRPELHYQISAYHNEILRLTDPSEFGAFLSLLQHNGFPTPLLDWTLSPYIAAYFAFREIDTPSTAAQNVCIFTFDYLEWEKSFEPVLNLRDQRQFVSVIRPYAKYNQRIISQRGANTITNVQDVGAYLTQRSSEAGKTFLRQFIIPYSERATVMRELHVMGINEMSLFPGLEGICRTFREQFFSIDSIHQRNSKLGALADLLRRAKGNQSGAA